MQINLDESITVLARRVKRLRGLKSYNELAVKLNLDRVKEALAQVESLLVKREVSELPKRRPRKS